MAGGRLTATQYADDVEPLLPDTAAVPGFLDCLSQYGDATGQRVQPPKSMLLPMGRDVGDSEAPVAGLRVVDRAKSLGVVFGSRGVVGVDWEQRLAMVRTRLQNISNIPDLSAFGRAFAVSGYALSTLLYHVHYAGALPAEHAATLLKWTAALVDRGLGPDDCLARPPGIPKACMEAHPRDGGFGLLPLRHHIHSRLACEAAQVLVGEASKPWVAAARALLQCHLPAVPGGGHWGLALCDRRWLFPAEGGPMLPQPLRAMAVGIRALPPLQCVGDGPGAPGPWCYHVPLWSNPVVAVQEQWDWFGQQRLVRVGLEFAFPGLRDLPGLQCVGEAVYWAGLLGDIVAAGGDPGAQQEAYRMHVFGPLLGSRSRYADMRVAHGELQRLLTAIYPAWRDAARAVLQARQPLAPLPVVTPALLATQRERVCADLGWHTRDGKVVKLSCVTVALATSCQHLDALAAIAVRHGDHLARAQVLDRAVHPTGRVLPPVRRVLARWWKLCVPNVYKESAWRLALNAFPTAQRMHLAAPCAACGALSPGVDHHFWECPVAVAVRREVEAQLKAHRFGQEPALAAAGSLACGDLWLGVLPHPRLHRVVWDMVCLAAVYAMHQGRKTAWAVSRDRLQVPVLVERVAVRAAVGAFWGALADFAVSATVKRRAQGVLLTAQPFLAWHVVLVSGGGLRVVRH